ncbi:MAG: hypothetical protein KC964_21425, partial [Candidatus Omnitrophica bacterium]|nr:hypothetical protein [Candidatus Omnitrophota bacterium]
MSARKPLLENEIFGLIPRRLPCVCLKLASILFVLQTSSFAAVVDYNATTDALTFTADAGEVDDVTVTAPSENTVVISVADTDEMLLFSDATIGNGFVLAQESKVLTIDTSLSPILTFDMDLSDMDDSLTFSLESSPNNVTDVTILGGGGTDTTTFTDSTTLGGSLTVTSDGIVLHGTVTTFINQTYNDPVVLTGDTVIESTGLGNIIFNSTVNGLFDLTVNTAAATSFLGPVGVGGDRLGGLTTGAGGTTVFNISSMPQVDIQNTAFFGDSVNVAGGGQRWNLRGETTFDESIGGAVDMILQVYDSVTFNGGVIFNGLQLTSGGQVFVNGGAITTLTNNFLLDIRNPVVLGADTVFTSNGVLRFRDTVDGAFNLVLNSDDTTNLRDVVGGSIPLASLTTDSPGTTLLEGGEINLSGNTLTFADPVTLGVDTEINDAGAVAFNNTLDGGFELTVDAGGDLNFAGVVGGTSPLASLAAISGGSMTVGASISTNGEVALTADDMAIGNPILAGTAEISLSPHTDGRPISLGIESAGSLSLTDTELDFLNATTLGIGSFRSGSITFFSMVNPSMTNTLSLITGDEIVDNNNVGFDIQVSNLALQAVNGIGLDTEVTTLAALNTFSGAIQIEETVAAGGLIVGSVDGVVGVRNTAIASSPPTLGVQIETNDGHLIVNEDIFNQQRNILLVAQEGEGMDLGDRTFTNNANITSASSDSQVLIQANNMTLSVGSTISAPDRVILQSDPAAITIGFINLGGDDGNNTLGLTDQEIDTVTTAGVLQIGYSGSG